MSSVFLCHSSDDKPFIRKLARELERHGVDVWLDEKEIKVGDSLRESIEKSILNSRYFLIALSNSSVNKNWVKKELNTAFTLEIEREEKIILPVLIEPTSIPPFLKDKKYADFSKSFESGLKDLLKVLSPESVDDRGIDLKTLQCSIILDIKNDDGLVVEYTKYQKIKSIKDNLTKYIEAFTSDGEINNFEVKPGYIGNKWVESGLTHVETHFNKSLNSGDILERKFTCTFRNAFMKSQEYWEEKQVNPSKNVIVKVIFPPSRPPIEYKVTEREGFNKMQSDLDIQHGNKGSRDFLKIKIPNPIFLRNYLLTWTW